MNQTFKKKVIAASLTLAFAATSGVVVGNQFDASTMSSPTTVVLVQGGLPKMTNALTLTESGTFANAVTNPIGFRVTIPTGIDLYGSYLANSIDSTATASTTASKFTPTAGNIYPLRYTGAALADSCSAFIYIDTALGGSTLSTTAQDTATYSVSRNLAVFAVNSASGVTMGLTGGKLNANASSTGLTNFFVGGLASSTNSAAYGAAIATSTAATHVTLRNPDGTAISATTFSSGKSNNIGSIKAETDGSLTMTLFASAQNSTASNSDTLTIPPLALAASNSAAVGNVSLTITDGINASPASTELINISGGTKAIATVTGSSLSVAKSSSTSTIPDAVLTLSNQAVDPIKIAFASPVTAATTNTITLTLSGGAKFVPAAAFATSAGAISASLSSSDTNTHFNGANGGGSLNADRTVLTLTLDNEAISADDSFLVDKPFLDLTSATAGDINMTVTSSIAQAGSQTIKLANAVARSAAVTYSDLAPTGYTTLFVGRTAQTTTDAIVLTEAATGSLLVNGAIVLTLDKGAKFTASSTITTTEEPVTSGTAQELVIPDITLGTTATASASTAVTTASTTAGAKNKSTLKGFSFDLSAASTGDMTVTVSGGAGAVGAVKIATIAEATSASVSGAMPTLVPGGSAATLADIVISESAYGALSSTQNSGVLSVRLPVGVTYDTSTVPTVTVTKADGTTALAGKVTTPATSHFTANAASVSGSTYNLQVIAPSNSSDGPMTIKISGLKAFAASTAASGDLSVLIHGNSAVLGTAPAAADEGSSAATVGAMPTKATVKVGTIVSPTVSQIPTATVTGAVSSQTVATSIVPAGNDQNKQGSIFVAALLPSTLGGGVYFMSNAGAWTQFSTCAAAPTYSEGTLAAVPTIPVVSNYDLTSLIGLRLYVGYGVGGALSTPGTACTNMLNNGTYNLTYTVK